MTVLQRSGRRRGRDDGHRVASRQLLSRLPGTEFGNFSRNLQFFEFFEIVVEKSKQCGREMFWTEFPSTGSLQTFGENLLQSLRKDRSMVVKIKIILALKLYLNISAKSWVLISSIFSSKSFFLFGFRVLVFLIGTCLWNMCSRSCRNFCTL